MNDDQANRDRIITEWFFQDWIGDKSHLPESEDVFVFMKILMDVMAIHGKLSEDERNYILGRAAIFGAKQEVLDRLQIYEPNLSGDMNNFFQDFDLPHVKKTRISVVYNLFRILGTDHKLHSEEINAIYMMAEKLGVSEEQVQQIQNLYEEEENLRRKRALLFFPRGFNDVLIEYQKLR